MTDYFHLILLIGMAMLSLKTEAVLWCCGRNAKCNQVRDNPKTTELHVRCRLVAVQSAVHMAKLCLLASSQKFAIAARDQQNRESQICP